MCSTPGEETDLNNITKAMTTTDTTSKRSIIHLRMVTTDAMISQRNTTMMIGMILKVILTITIHSTQIPTATTMTKFTILAVMMDTEKAVVHLTSTASTTEDHGIIRVAIPKTTGITIVPHARILTRDQAVKHPQKS